MRRGPMVAAAAAALAAAGVLAWRAAETVPLPAPAGPAAAAPDRAARDADDIVDAVRRGRISSALAGIAAFHRQFGLESLDPARRAALEEAGLEAGRWGLRECVSLAEAGEVRAAEALLAKAVRALEGTAAEGECAAPGARVRLLAEGVQSRETARAREEALAPARRIAAEAREKGVEAPEAALSDLLGTLKVMTDPDARKVLEEAIAPLQVRVRTTKERQAVRAKADEAIQAGNYEKARDLLKSLVEGAEGAGAPPMEAARDAEKLAGVKDLEENREPEALAACRKALRWVVKQQQKDGSFSLPVLGDDGKARSEEALAKARNRAGITGLAALALLGHVRYDVTDEFAPALDRALAWLVAAQKKDGSFAGLYENAIASLALVEADRLLHRRDLRPAATLGVRWLLDAQNNDGGWRYTPRNPPSDVSVTGWALQAVLHAKAGGYEVPQNAVDLAGTYLDRMTDPVTGTVGYVITGQGSRAMTAASLFCRLRLGQGTADDRVRMAADALVKSTADRYWTESSYGMFYASDAMSRLGGTYWTTWSPFLKKTLLGSQVKKGDAEGAWPSAGDLWGRREDVGPVVVTCLNALSLENFFEHRE
jgi:hypothetical protein